MTKKLVEVSNVGVGNPREYRSVHARGGVVPRVDAVEMTVRLLWLKNQPLAITRLNSRDARQIAIDLLVAAEALDGREAGNG